MFNICWFRTGKAQKLLLSEYFVLELANPGPSRGRTKGRIGGKREIQYLGRQKLSVTMQKILIFYDTYYSSFKNNITTKNV